MVMVKGVIAFNFVRVNTGLPWIVMVNAFLSLKFHVANISLSLDFILFSFSEALVDYMQCPYACFFFNYLSVCSFLFIAGLSAVRI